VGAVAGLVAPDGDAGAVAAAGRWKRESGSIGGRGRYKQASSGGLPGDGGAAV
jgi:hypothetical protein